MNTVFIDYSALYLFAKEHLGIPIFLDDVIDICKKNLNSKEIHIYSSVSTSNVNQIDMFQKLIERDNTIKYYLFTTHGTNIFTFMIPDIVTKAISGENIMIISNNKDMGSLIRNPICEKIFWVFFFSGMPDDIKEKIFYNEIEYEDLYDLFLQKEKKTFIEKNMDFKESFGPYDNAQVIV